MQWRTGLGCTIPRDWTRMQCRDCWGRFLDEGWMGRERKGSRTPGRGGSRGMPLAKKRPSWGRANGQEQHDSDVCPGRQRQQGVTAQGP